MNRESVYFLRQAILKTAVNIATPNFRLDDLMRCPHSMLEALRPTNDELAEQCDFLVNDGCLKQIILPGKTCYELTRKGYKQITPRKTTNRGGKEKMGKTGKEEIKYITRDWSKIIHKIRSEGPANDWDLNSVLREKVEVLKERLKLADERVLAERTVIKEKNRLIEEVRAENNRLRKAVKELEGNH